MKRNRCRFVVVEAGPPISVAGWYRNWRLEGARFEFPGRASVRASTTLNVAVA
ncbi:MAG: hypothetical protein WAV28_01020 [Sedimentisphaerales bacterium]